MKVMHLLSSGEIGGMQTLMKLYSRNSELENIFIFAWAEGINKNEIEKYGSKTYYLDIYKNGLLKSIKKVFKIFELERPEAVVVHISPFLRILSCIITMMHKNVDLYYYCHSSMKYQLSKYKGIKRLINDVVNRVCFVRCKKIIAISNYVKDTILDAYPTVNPNNIVTIYNCVDDAMYCNDIHNFRETINFVYVGRVIEEKGIQIAIRALSKITNDCNWKLNIVGDGEYLTSLQTLVKQLRLEKKVYLCGNRSDIAKILDDSDIFLHTCLVDEGFGIGIVEAMASGKICVCSRSGAIPEIINHGVDGFLVEKDDIADTINCIDYILHCDADDINRIQIMAKEKSELFTEHKYTAVLDSLFLGEGNED